MSDQSRRAVNPRGSGARLREELIDAAFRLYERTGGEAELTLRGVAREAGVAAPSVYTQFESVDAMVLAVLERTVEIVGAEVFAAAEGIPDGMERLRAVARAYIAWGVANPGQYKTAMNGKVLRAVEGGPQIGARHAELMISSLTELVRGVPGAPASPESARFAAETLWAGAHGIVMLRISKPYYPWPDVERQIDALLAGAGIVSPTR